MSGIAICSDSSALLPERVAEELGITIVPIPITLDGEPYQERDDSIDAFYARLAEGAEVTTAQPSPGELLDAYARAAAAGADEVLSIHLDARVSGTVGSAELAARDAPIPVTVVDTRTVSFGVGLCVQAAAKAIANGASVREAVASLSRTGPALRNVFVAHGGQAGRLPAQPEWSVLEFADGMARPSAACEGVDEAIAIMSARVLDTDAPVRAAVGHAAAATEQAADALALSLARIAHVVDVARYRVGPAVGAHTGPFSFGAFWWPSP